MAANWSMGSLEVLDDLRRDHDVDTMKTSIA
jgi:hypothetical protein